MAGVMTGFFDWLDPPKKRRRRYHVHRSYDPGYDDDRDYFTLKGAKARAIKWSKLSRTVGAVRVIRDGDVIGYARRGQWFEGEPR
jgi:hypothetical protein